MRVGGMSRRLGGVYGRQGRYCGLKHCGESEVRAQCAALLCQCDPMRGGGGGAGGRGGVRQRRAAGGTEEGEIGQIAMGVWLVLMRPEMVAAEWVLNRL